MTKSTTNSKQASKKTKSFIPQQYQDAFAVLLLGILLIVFFKDALLGDSSFMGAADYSSPASFRNYLNQAEEFPLWQPYIFGGLPGYAAVMDSGVRTWDVTYSIFYYVSVILREIFNSELAYWIIWYLILVSGMYFLMRQHKFDKLISFFTAFAFIFGTGIVIWLMIGHSTKGSTFAAAPWIFLMIERLKEKKSFLNIVLLILAMHVLIAGNHVQMVFYTACAVSIYLICDLIHKIVKKENLLSMVKLIGIFVIATSLAVLMSADRYLSILEYTPYSTRGSAPITERIESKDLSSKATKADYEYATMWSNSPSELIDMFIPSYHGFGKVNYSGILTSNRETKISTYWGQKPFEDATPYMGAVVLFLAVLGAIRYFKHNIFVLSLAIMAVFATLLSFGYTFPILYDIFFYYFPKFSSFRAPVMVLVLVHFTVPILAGFGLKALSEMREQYVDFKSLAKTDKVPLAVFYTLVGIFIFSGIIFATGLESSYTSDVSNALSKSYGAQTAQTLSQFVYENAVADWTVIGFLCALIALLSYLFVNKKLITHNVFVVAIICIAMIDIWRISYRAMDFVDKSIEKQPFPKTDVVDFIKNEQQQSKERFRVCDLTLSIANSHTYFLIENINGYHAAKLRLFQDMMDVMCGGGTSNVTHPFLWNLMNAKYIITSQKFEGGSEPLFQSRQTGAFVYYNPAYCKRAYFVDSVKVETDDYAILQHLNASDFNPKTLAYIEKPLTETIIPAGEYAHEMKTLEQQIQKQFDSTFKLAENENNTNKDDFVPTAKIAEYKNEYIKIETETKGQHLLVLSEMYYPINWTAYVDGKLTEIHKTNFAFRSIVVPAGKHTVEFRFASDRFILGKNFSAGTNAILIIALVVGILLEVKKRRTIKQQN